MLRTCPECNCEFEPRRNAATCSNRCNARAWRRRKGLGLADAASIGTGVATYGTSACAHCGEDFVKRQATAMFCSKRCLQSTPKAKEQSRLRAQRRTVRYQEDPEYRARELALDRERAREKGVQPALTGVTDRCVECGEPFPGRLGKRFCSKSCLKKAQWRRGKPARLARANRTVSLVGALAPDGAAAALEFEALDNGGYWVWCACGPMMGVPDPISLERRHCWACGRIWLVNMEEMQAVRDVQIAC